MVGIVTKLKSEIGTEVKVTGLEAIMASLGVFTTIGKKLAFAILDMGSASINVLSYQNMKCAMTHPVGTGELALMLI